MNRIASQLLLTVLVTVWTAGAAQVVLYQTDWEAAPASPAWALGTVSPQNGWLNDPSPLAHEVVSNGSARAVVSGQAVVTPYGSQFHRFNASSGSNNVFAFTWRGRSHTQPEHHAQSGGRLDAEWECRLPFP